MPSKKPLGLAMLLQVEADRAALAEREKSARAAAASEIGEAVLDAVGPAFSLDELRRLLRAAQRAGFGAAMEALGQPQQVRPPIRNGAAKVVDHALQ